ncbi:unnamed protein product [Rhizophagus irregularis]|nr:unnamed protein product [Rhizophagus irregularis]CAB5364207.1 unnamed protein product [Rhizophagus irregularis]
MLLSLKKFMECYALETFYSFGITPYLWISNLIIKYYVNVIKKEDDQRVQVAYFSIQDRLIIQLRYRFEYISREEYNIDIAIGDVLNMDSL